MLYDVTSLAKTQKVVEIKWSSQTEQETGCEAVELKVESGVMEKKLKVYADRMSQPSRAVLTLCR